MCGIAAAITTEANVSIDLANLLEYVQHRGQDTAGIFTTDGRPHRIRDEGLVKTIFTQERIDSLEGKVGVGHTRYKTTGLGGVRNAQPFHATSPDGAILVGMSHNGHVRNLEQLTKELKSSGIILESDCDVEPILRVFARELQKDITPEMIYNAAHKTMNQVIGAYSVVAAVRDNKNDKDYLVVFTDPRGIRPCVIGQNETGWAATSESMPLELNGYKNIRDVRPGEVIIVDGQLNVQSRIVRQEKPAHCFFEWIYFADASSVIQGMRANEIRGALGIELAKEHKDLTDRIDVVVCVPQTPIPTAVQFASEIGKPYRNAIHKYRFAGRNFLKPTQEQREEETDKNIYVFREVVQGKRVAVIDDSIVRGTTSRKVLTALKQAGATEVHFISASPPITHPCELGINTPTYQELFAHNYAPENYAKELGATTVRYLSIPGLQKVLTQYQSTIIPILVEEGLLSKKALEQQRNFCYACITGENPTEDEFKRRLRQTL